MRETQAAVNVLAGNKTTQNALTTQAKFIPRVFETAFTNIDIMGKPNFHISDNINKTQVVAVKFKN